MKRIIAFQFGVIALALTSSLCLGSFSQKVSAENNFSISNSTSSKPDKSENPSSTSKSEKNESSDQSDQEQFKKLLKKWTLKFKFRGSFEEAIYKFQEIGQVVVYVDWVALKECGIKRSSQVRFRNTGKRFGEVLDIFLTRTSRKNKDPLGYYFQNGFLIITSNENMLDYLKRHQPEKPPLVIPKLKRSTDKINPIPDDNHAGNSDKENNSPRFEQNVDPENLKRFGEIKLENITLGDLIKHLRKETELNFHANWNALAKSEITKDSKVNITGINLTLAQVLDLAFSELNFDKDKLEKVYWIVDNNIIRISTGKNFNSTLRTKIFDVTQLLQPRIENTQFTIGRAQAYIAGYEPIVSNNAVAYKPIISYAFSGITLRNYDDDPPTPGISKREQLRRQLISSVKQCLPEDMWRPMGPGSIMIFRKKLVVTQTLLGWKLMQD